MICPTFAFHIPIEQTKAQSKTVPEVNIWTLFAKKKQCTITVAHIFSLVLQYKGDEKLYVAFIQLF